MSSHDYRPPLARGGIVKTPITLGKLSEIVKNSAIEPSHYKQGEIECIDAIKSSLGVEGFKAYLKGSVMKYIWRYEKKNGKEDLDKANWFLGRLRKETGNGNDK